MISWFWTKSLQWHRNITHSLAGAPVVALLTVAVVALVARRQIRWWPAFLIALLGVASHLVLDLTNIYGVRLLLPFSGHWTHWDLTPVIDYVIWTILLLGVAAPALSRLVGSEIGEPHPDKGKAGWAVTALLLLSVYDYSRGVFHERAVNIVDSHIYNGLAPRRVGAFPTPNLLVWRGMAEMSNAYVEVPLDLRGDFHMSDAVTYYKPPRTPAMQAAMATYPFQEMLDFVQYPLWVVSPGRVALIDLRYGTPQHAGFAATAFVDDNNRVLSSSFGMGEIKPR